MPSLLPYQETAANWLAARTRAYLADEPGLGKTPETIVALTRVGAERTVVVAPASAVPVWHRIRREWAMSSHAFEIMSYDKLVRSPEQVDRLVAWGDSLVVDEVHMTAHTGAMRTRYAMRLANRFPRVYVLSGTPMRNRPRDLYPVLRAIWPDELKRLGCLRRSEFSRMFEVVVNVPHQGWNRELVRGVRNAPLLKDLLRRIMLRRTLEEVKLELPPLRWNVEPVAFTDAEASDFRQMFNAAVPWEAREDIRAALDAGAIPGAENEHVATARRLLGTAKALPAARLLRDELSAGLLQKVVVIAYHRDVLAVIAEALYEFGVARLDGSTSAQDRAMAVDAFQGNPDVRVFLGQITAAGQAITLTAAHDLVLVESSWVPDDNLQAVKRIHRFTQEHPCRVRELVVPDSVDEACAEVRRRKLAIKEQLSL